MKTKIEILEAIIETWETFCEIDQSHFTIDDFRKAEDLLDDVKRLITEEGR